MRPEKEAIIEEVKERISDAVFVLLADYQGLNVEKTHELRGKLHDTKAEMFVVKNRMLRRATADLPCRDISRELSGPSAMIYGAGDIVQTAKALKAFIKENELPVIKVGTLDGVILTAEDIQKLADLPSREQLLAKVVGTIAAPLSQIVGVMHQKVSSLLYVLKAVEEKKAQSS